MVGSLCLLIILVALAGVLAHNLILHRQPAKPPQKIRVDKKPIQRIPAFEIYPKEEVLPPQPDVRQGPPSASELPKVALIIDDIGFDRILDEKFLSLNAAFTFSILPHSPFKKRFVQVAREKGFETMLHLPMEPDEYPKVDPGVGALLTSMSPDQLIGQLEKNLDDVPFIKGVNNHMGSKMTTVSIQMYQIFSILKKRGLYFIDSRTTANSLCKPSARLLRIPFAERHVFIDHINNAEAIRRQIEHLIFIAEVRGEAVGIAHPNETTYNVLRDILPDLKNKVHLVPASQIVHIAG